MLKHLSHCFWLNLTLVCLFPGLILVTHTVSILEVKKRKETKPRPAPPPRLEVTRKDADGRTFNFQLSWQLRTLVWSWYWSGDSRTYVRLHATQKNPGWQEKRNLTDWKGRVVVERWIYKEWINIFAYPKRIPPPLFFFNPYLFPFKFFVFLSMYVGP